MPNCSNCGFPLIPNKISEDGTFSFEINGITAHGVHIRCLACDMISDIDIGIWNGYKNEFSLRMISRARYEWQRQATLEKEVKIK